VRGEYRKEDKRRRGTRKYSERTEALRNRCERCAAAVKKPRSFGGTEEYRIEDKRRRGTKKYKERARGRTGGDTGTRRRGNDEIQRENRALRRYGKKS